MTPPSSSRMMRCVVACACAEGGALGGGWGGWGPVGPVLRSGPQPPRASSGRVTTIFPEAEMAVFGSPPSPEFCLTTQHLLRGGGGDLTPPTHPPFVPPPAFSVIGKFFTGSSANQKSLSGAFGASQFRAKNFFGAFGASKNSGSLEGGGGP